MDNFLFYTYTYISKYIYTPIHRSMYTNVKKSRNLLPEGSRSRLFLFLFIYLFISLNLYSIIILKAKYNGFLINLSAKIKISKKKSIVRKIIIVLHSTITQISHRCINISCCSC